MDKSKESKKCKVIKKEDDKIIFECENDDFIDTNLSVNDSVYLPHVRTIYSEGFSNNNQNTNNISITVLFTTLASAFGFGFAYLLSDILYDMLSSEFQSYWIRILIMLVIFIPLILLFVYLSYIFFIKIKKKSNN
jgi:hypothetical protein